MKVIINDIDQRLNNHKETILEKPKYGDVVSRFYEIRFKLAFGKSSELSRLSMINKILAKEYQLEYHLILAAFYKLYMTVSDAYSELEDILGEVIQLAKQNPHLKEDDYNLRKHFTSEFLKMFTNDEFLKVLLIEGNKKLDLPEIYQSVLDKMDPLETKPKTEVENNFISPNDLRDFKCEIYKDIMPLETECRAYLDSCGIRGIYDKDLRKEQVETKNTQNMGIDELLDFIESKTEKGSNGVKKQKKKAINNINTLSGQNKKTIPCEVEKAEKLEVLDEKNVYKENKEQYKKESKIGSQTDKTEPDDEIEEFKTKLKEASIKADKVEKIKPNFIFKWD